MAKDGKLILTLLGPDGAPFKEKVDVFLEHQHLSDRRASRGVDASKKIAITGLHRAPQGLYLLRVEAAGLPTAGQYVNVAPSGDTSVELTLGQPKPSDAGGDGVERERLQFRTLLAENPNFFGNVTDQALAEAFAVVVPIATNTKYEQLHCVGLYPEGDLLEAVLEIKQPVGYQESLCQEGSKEYVAFYVDWGSGFVSAGAPAQVNVYNLASVHGGPLFYAVRKPFAPPDLKSCTEPQVVRVRAILSWEAIPTGPGYIPVWGNVVDAWVQVRPEKQPLLLTPILGPAKLFEPPIPTEQFILQGSKEEIKALLDHTVAAEEKIRKEGKVEPKRLDFKMLVQKNPNHFGGISQADEPAEILAAFAKLPAQTVGYYSDQVVFNPNLLKWIEVFLEQTKYEQLRCVGLYPEGDLLEAVIEVKLPNGFSGDLCSLGSKEYVAFYVDWDGSGYQHVATASVTVHDIPEVAKRPLHYAVQAKVPDPHLKPCSIENVVKVKAILSWNVDPTPFGPNYTPTWGNALTQNVQIRPVDGASAKCDLEIVNQVHTQDIAQSGGSQGLAIKIDGNEHTVPGTFDRPFGGVIACWGNVNVPGAFYYRFLFKEEGSAATWQPVTDKRRARGIFGFTAFRDPDGDGWFAKSTYDFDVENYSPTALVHWNSAGKNGKYRLRLELGDAAKNSVGAPCEVVILLDNAGPELLAFSNPPPPLPAQGVVVKGGEGVGAYKKCGTFLGPEPIRVFGNFRDNYFRTYTLLVLGGNIAVKGHPLGSARYDTFPGESPVGPRGISGAGSGMGQELLAFDLCKVPQAPEKIRCAYSIELRVSDRAIVGSLSGYAFHSGNHGANASVTFDWDPQGCK